jgi:GntR family transcriptional regulator / MocR family aminotransferase
MRDDWTTSGLDLLLELDPGAGRGAGLEQALRQAIQAGRLRPGTSLPSSRALARDLGFSRGTVSEAYNRLVAEGYLVARHGAGTAVAPVPTAAPAPAAAGLAAPPDRLPERPRADFRPGRPDLGGFPRDLWLAATRQVLRTAHGDALGYGDPRGRPELRHALADYLGRARGVLTSPELLLVCSGFTQGLALLCGVLRDRGVGAVALEDPCLPDNPAIVAQAGLRPRGVPVDADGLQVERLGGVDAGAAVVTPAHQFPLGPALAPARRAALLAWARRAVAVVVEDDYDGEFRYDRPPVGALQGLDPGRVVYAGTASKTLAPGLRLAWLALPPWLLEPMVEAKRLADQHSAAVDQLVLAELIRSGGLDRHVRRCRLRYRRRRDRLRSAMAERVPRLPLVGTAAGLQAVALLPEDGPAEDEVVDHLAARSVALHGLGHYWFMPRHAPQGLVIGYAAPPEHAFPAALDALTTALAELYPASTSSSSA